MALNNEILVIYDGECPFCSWTARFIENHQGKKPIRLLSRFHPEAQKYHALETESLILMYGKTRYEKSSAVLRIARLLGFPWNVFYIFLVIPVRWRDFIYDWIASNRMKWFKSKNSCEIIPNSSATT